MRTDRADRTENVWQGLMVGLIGYVTIALSVSIGDVLQGRSFFYTVSLFGGWLFYDLKDAADVRVWPGAVLRSEEHTSELQSQSNLVCRLLLEKKKKTHNLSRSSFSLLRLAVRVVLVREWSSTLTTTF